MPFSFKVTSNSKSLFLVAESDEDAKTWKRKVREAIRSLRQLHAPPPPPRLAKTVVEDPSDMLHIYGKPGAWRFILLCPVLSCPLLSLPMLSCLFLSLSCCLVLAAGLCRRSGGVCGRCDCRLFVLMIVGCANVLPPVFSALLSRLALTGAVSGSAAASTFDDGPSGMPASMATPAPVVSSSTQSKLRRLSNADLRNTFCRAVERLRPWLGTVVPDSGVDASSLHLTDVQKLQFYGYFKQAVVGDVSTSVSPTQSHDATVAVKTAAWCSLRGLSRRDAMRAFIYRLYQVDPLWDGLHAHDADAGAAAGAGGEL